MTDFPAFSRQWKKTGRVCDVKVVGPHLVLNLNGEELQIRYQPEHDLIQKNDWIAIDSENRITRVTPSIREPLKASVSADTLKKWSLFLKSVRQFFETRGFLELQTPSLVACPGTEPALDTFSTELKISSGLKKVFLPTSPELHLKKALTMGFEKIFEIAKCYRNNEVTDLHQPEFWMLEWYRSFANLNDIEIDVVQLIYYLCDQAQVKKPEILNFTIHQLFKKHLNFDLKPETSKDDLRKLALDQGLHVNDSFSIDDYFFLLMLEKIEPQLPKDSLVFVEKYPPFQAALARRDQAGWADRFEVYWKGMELANAFDELNDSKEQRLRSQEDLSKREGRNQIGLDEEFFQALESGMPPSAGIALGLERVFMALHGINRIQDLRLFPVSKISAPY
jgi:lysyl-tRNA synthetase class 2